LSITKEQSELLSELLAHSNRAILMTYRKDGQVQSSPMSVHAGPEGTIQISTRAWAAKVKNLRRNPRAAACLITAKFLGPWLHVEGDVTVTELPEALPGLRALHGHQGQTTEGEAFDARMVAEQRVLLTLTPTRIVVPPPSPYRPTTYD
jgi:PPOX class probable F420-dependent enzyme